MRHQLRNMFLQGRGSVALPIELVSRFVCGADGCLWKGEADRVGDLIW